EGLAMVGAGADRGAGRLEVRDVDAAVRTDLDVGVPAAEARTDVLRDREALAPVVAGPEADPGRRAAAERGADPGRDALRRGHVDVARVARVERERGLAAAVAAEQDRGGELRGDRRRLGQHRAGRRKGRGGAGE